MMSEIIDTEKIAKVMANSMDAKLVKAQDITLEELEEYDFISFSPGIYAFNQDKDMIGFMEERDLKKGPIHIIYIPDKRSSHASK